MVIIDFRLYYRRDPARCDLRSLWAGHKDPLVQALLAIRGSHDRKSHSRHTHNVVGHDWAVTASGVRLVQRCAEQVVGRVLPLSVLVPRQSATAARPGPRGQDRPPVSAATSCRTPFSFSHASVDLSSSTFPAVLLPSDHCRISAPGGKC